MKKKITLAAFLTIGLTSLQAQQIISMTLSPAAPDNTDTVYVYITCEFPNGGCAGTAYYSQTGNDISGSSLHCMGGLTVICTDVDTFKINPQPVGAYNVYYTLSSGFGGFPCSPGIVPDDEDTLTFNVVSGSSINENENSLLNVFPNPATETCVVQVNSALVGNGKLVLTDETGRVV
ncbi:MAG: hypothetical protein ACHQF2_00750 [Flavobacteriales bacterium]